MSKIYGVIQIKIVSVSLRKATNISKSFTYKMAAKLNWHRYGTKLRHRHPIHTGRGGGGATQGGA